MKTPFFLVVHTKAKRGGAGTKHPSTDAAVKRAREILAADSSVDGFAICAPIMYVERERPPVKVTTVNPLTGEPQLFSAHWRD